MSKISAVNNATCHQLNSTEKPFILLLKEGESIFDEITRCATTIDLKSAAISGLGSIGDITIGFFDHQTNQHLTRVFSGIFELVSLNGNITFADDKYFLHIHAAIGDGEFNVYGGHIMNAFAGPSTEISIIPFPAKISRKYNEKLGIRLISCNVL